LEWIDITDELKAAATGWDLYLIVIKYWDETMKYPLFKVDNQSRIFRRGSNGRTRRNRDPEKTGSN
jgi:hypothetical protein